MNFGILLQQLKWSVKIVALISLYQVTKWIEEVQDDTDKKARKDESK